MSQKKGNTIWEALGLFFNLGFVIAIPLVILTLIGRYVDTIYHTSPLFLLLAICASIIISSFWLIRHFQKYLQMIEKEEQNNDKDNQT